MNIFVFAHIIWKQIFYLYIQYTIGDSFLGAIWLIKFEWKKKTQPFSAFHATEQNRNCEIKFTELNALIDVSFTAKLWGSHWDVVMVNW